MTIRRKPLASARALLKGGESVRLTRLFAPTVGLVEQFKLDDDTDTDKKPEVPKYKWLHVASEGDFSGHADGEFVLDRAVFSAFIKNFHADPRYKAPTAGFTEGTDGGMGQVLPFDFEHASELAATEGSIPVTGAPAPAWAMEVELRDGPNGEAQLWSYTKLGERIRGYIANDEYRHVSIAFSLDASDPESAASIGPRLSSIAFTNHPFLRGLTSIAARDRTVGTQLLYWYDAAGSPEQGMEYTRKCLGLGATADVDAVKAEVQKIAGFAAKPDTIPPGVDVGEIFESLRKIWSLPVSATVPEIVGQIDTAAAQMTAALAAAAAASATVPAPVAAPVPPPAPAAALPPTPAPVAATEPKVTTMLKKLIKALRNLSTVENKQLLTFARSIKLDASEVTEDEATSYVEQLIKFVENLDTILQALGVADPTAALDAIKAGKAAETELAAAKAKLTELSAAIDEATAMQSEVDESMEEADVDAAASAKGLAGADGTVDPVVGNMLKSHRRSVIAVEVAKLGEKDKTPKKLREARQRGRQAFLTECGVVDKDRERLLKNLVAGPNGVQLSPPEQGGAGGAAPAAGRRLTNVTPTVPVIDISQYSGVNGTERLMSYINDKEAPIAKQGHSAVWNRARALRALAARGEVKIVDEGAAA